MANPNKTVEKAAKARPFNSEKQAVHEASRHEQVMNDEFMQFVFKSASEGKTFSSIEEAEIEFQKTKEI